VIREKLGGIAVHIGAHVTALAALRRLATGALAVVGVWAVRRSVRVGTLALTLHLLASSLVAVAQPTGKVNRIGFLRHFACPDQFGLKDLRQRLGQLGYIEGRNIAIECRAAPGKWEELPELAAELVRLNIDVLVTEGTPASLAAKQATRLVPVIMVYVGDPVASGLVSSLGRPGGNITGVSMNANEIVRKDIELLKELAPGLSRVAVWMDSTNPSHLPAFAAMEATADRLKVRLQRVEIRTATDLDGGFAATLRQRAEAVAVYPLSTMPVDIKRIAEFAIKNRLPTVTNTAAYIKEGLLAGYGPNVPDQYHRAAIYIDRVLKGAQPAELPVEQPTKLDLVINGRTAKALGLALPQSILLRAVEVVE
jgi:putative ABC transport system substrate-binding protein